MDSSTSGRNKSQRTGEPWIDKLSKMLATRISQRTALKVGAGAEVFTHRASRSLDRSYGPCSGLLRWVLI